MHLNAKNMHFVLHEFFKKNFIGNRDTSTSSIFREKLKIKLTKRV